MKKTIIITAALLGVIFITSNAFSWGRGGGCGGYGGYGDNNAPALTQEQQTQLSELRQKYIDETYQTRSDMMEKQRNLDMLMETSAPDKAKLTALSNEINDLRKQMFDKRIEYTLAAKKIAPGLDMGTFRHMGKGFGNGQGSGRGNGPCARFNGSDNTANCPRYGQDQAPVTQ